MTFLLIAGFAETLLNFRYQLIKDLQENGFQVHVAAPDLQHKNQIRLELESLNLTVHNIPLRRTGTNPFIDLSTLLALWRLMKKLQPDFVLSYTVKPVVYGTLAAWLTNVPKRFALITGLGYAFTGEATGARRIVNCLVKILYQQALRRAHKVFFQNTDDQSLFQKIDLLYKTVPSVVINGSGVDLKKFNVANLPLDGPHFLLIARLLGDKGVREYAHAAKRIKSTHPNVRFSLVGWIDENPDAISQSELDKWVSEGTLEYLGRMRDVRPAIAQSSVFVLPSYREGTPRVVLEAMAMGRAIITTDAPGCRETVLDGDNGFLVPVKSVDKLEQAMLKFVIDPTLAGRMGQRARRLAVEKYDVHKVNAKILSEMKIK